MYVQMPVLAYCVLFAHQRSSLSKSAPPSSGTLHSTFAVVDRPKAVVMSSMSSTMRAALSQKKLRMRRMSSCVHDRVDHALK